MFRKLKIHKNALYVLLPENELLFKVFLVSIKEWGGNGLQALFLLALENSKKHSGVMIEISSTNLLRKELHILFPLTIGMLVYAITRPIGPIPQADILILPFQIPNAIPVYLTSWLPDFLWAYAFGSFLAFIQPKRPLVGLLLPVGIGLLHEFGQGIAVFSGTFDPLDVLAYLLAGIIIFPIHYQKLSTFYLFSYEKIDT